MSGQPGPAKAPATARVYADEWHNDAAAYASLQQILLRCQGDHLGPIFRDRVRRTDPAGRSVAILFTEWQGIVELCAQSEVQKWTRRTRTAHSIKAVPLPPIVDEALSDPHSPLFVVVGRAFFADSAKSQRATLAKIRKLSQEGPNASRRQTALIRREMPRAKRLWGGLDIAFRILPYRAERRLLRLYIKRELEQAGCSADEPGEAAKARSRKAIEEMLAALPWLPEHYKLSAEHIRSGAMQKNFADKETAKHFGFKSANALRKFLSTHRPSR